MSTRWRFSCKWLGSARPYPKLFVIQKLSPHFKVALMLSPFWNLSQIGVSFSPPAAIGFQPIYTDAETKFAKEPLHSWFTTSITQGPYCALPYVDKMISLLLVEMSMIWRPLLIEVYLPRAFSLICVILSFRLWSCKGLSRNTVLFQTE